MHLGWCTDDLLLIGETGVGEQRKLAAQVKRTFTVSAADDDCRSTIQGMWDDFLASERFDCSADRLAVITLHGTATLVQSFNSLLQGARATNNADDFHRRLALEGYISKKAKKQHEALQTILAEHTGAPADEDLYWRFLRTVNVLSFDLNTVTAQTEAHMLTILAHTAIEVPDPRAAARTTWARLLQCASEGGPAAASYRRNDLPRELLKLHSAISTSDSLGLQALFQHGKTVRDNIHSTIGQSYEIDRSTHVATLLDQLAEHQVVIVSGTAGSGKSALAKRLLDQVELDRPVLAFQAVEFATGHIDETLANAQTPLNAQRLFALAAGHDKTLVLVESVERLLEHSIRDAFSHLLQFASRDSSIQLVLTCRSYSLETVRNALLAPIGLVHAVLELPTLSDEELDRVQAHVPNLGVPLGDSQLRSFLRTPYVLDIASRLDWREGTRPKTPRTFRDKCWEEVIRADDHTAGGMPRRREKAFLDIAYRRATELRPFVKAGVSDGEALDALCRASLLECSPESSALFAPAHDVLEDWAILRWLDDQYVASDDPQSELASCVGGYPALRRGFRRWLGERFVVAPDPARQFVLHTLGRVDLPSHFRDDCLVAALLSERAVEFLEGCKSRLADGDARLLVRIIHVLRVACKESPHWLNLPGLPSQMLIPAGPGWAPTLELVSSLIDDLLPEHAPLIVGLVEDWAKQVDWRNPTPPGFEAAGSIIGALLPLSNDYRSDDMRKRLLEVMLKIPRAVPQFSNLIHRARTADRMDLTASDLADLVLGGISASYICRDFPSEVMALLNDRLRLSEADLHRDLPFPSFEVDAIFGIREYGVSAFFPASALQGPFGPLLKSHPQEAVTFIVDLLNHAADWYGEQRWPAYRLEPAWQITLEIPGSGPIQQWMNPRLYTLYRGMTVGPAVLQSALMALESWLLALGKIDDVDLESWLLHILSASNNVMATGVVASACIAYPAKAGPAGLALLSSRDLIQCDRSRLASEPTTRLEMFTGLIPAHRVYEQERKESNSLKHRQEDLESLAARMQLTDLRERVWQIIDRHRTELPKDQDDETRVWRLALHRMDLRGYKPVESPKVPSEDADQEGGTHVYLRPGEVEADLQRMVDASSESLAIKGRHVSLLQRATAAWQDRNSKEAADWKALLSEAQAVEPDVAEPEDFSRGGPGLVAAVCIRDHLDELAEGDFHWCARRIESEVRRDSDCADDMTRYARGLRADRAAASVVCLLAVHERSSETFETQALLALALTHPVYEVAAYANGGVGAFLTTEQKELVLRCARAAAHQARLTAVFRNEAAKRPFVERAHGRELIDQAAVAVRQEFERGGPEAPTYLTLLDFDDEASAVAIRTILGMLSYHPEWEESRDFFSRTAIWLAERWARDRRHSSGYGARNYELEHEALASIARFVLALPTEEARRVAGPLISASASSPREAENFVHQLILAADTRDTDCFWELWQDLADKATSAPWASRLKGDRPYESAFIDRIFLGTYWKDDVKDWKRLAGHAHRLDALARRLPPTTVCLLAYTRFLSTIGQRSLPDALKVVATVFQRGDSVVMASDANIAFYLETLLRRFVYGEPRRLKSDPALRDAILGILEALIAAGSSSAYRIRDDFLTPLSAGIG